MTKKPQPKPAVKANSSLYYLGRILQRLVLFTTITVTGIYWALLITVMVLNIVSNEAKDTIYQNHVLDTITNGLQAHAVKWAVLTAAVSLLLLTIARFRKYEKPLVVDGIVIAVFCLLSALFAESFVGMIYTPFN